MKIKKTRRQGKGAGANGNSKLSVGELLRRHPDLLSIFEEHGIHFCAGCFLTLTLPLERAAAYHAVTDIKGLLKDLSKGVKEHG